MRTWLPITVSLFVVLTIVLTIIFSDSPKPAISVTGMNVEVAEGEVQVSNGLETGRVYSGESAKLTKDGLQKGSGDKKGGETGYVITQANHTSEERQPLEEAADTLADNPLSGESAIDSVTKEFYWISGYVLNEDGEYLVKSRIRCRRNIERREEPAGNAVTDKNGYYAFELPGAGSYRLTSSPSYEYFEKTESVSLSEESKTAVVNFLHKKGTMVLKGRIVAKKTGEPIAGADVCLRGHQDAPEGAESNPEAVSGEDGRFVIRNFVEGTYDFIARAEGYMDYNARQRKWQDIPEPLAGVFISEDSRSKEYLIKMEEAGSVTVHVMDAGQSPVQDVDVVARSYGDAHSEPVQNTDSSGVCTFTNIPPGKVIFQARKEGYGETFSEVVETGTQDSPVEVTIELGASSSMTGHIVYKDGSPSAGWRIFLKNTLSASRMNLEYFDSAYSETGEEGEYSLQGLGKGIYQFILFEYREDRTNRVAAEPIITLESGEHKTGVDFVLKQGEKTVSGIVTAQDGNPIPGAKVEVHPAGDAGPNTIFSEGSSITDEKGEFSVGNLCKKPYVMVSVEAEGYKPFRDGFPMDKYVSAILSTADIIAGVVLEQTTRQPIPGANVILRTKYGRDQGEITNVNGAFEFSGFGGGTYELFALADGYSCSQPLRIDTESGIAMNSFVIELDKAHEFRGIVLDPAGNPVAGAVTGLESRMKILPGDESRGFVLTETYRTQEDGSFVIPNRGHFQDGIIIQHEQFAMAKHPLPAEWNNEEPLVIYLNMGGSIEGVVLDENHEPVAGSQIQCISLPDRLFRTLTVSGQDGTYRLERLTAADYFVRALLEGEEIGEKRISVQEGQTARADFNAGE